MLRNLWTNTYSKKNYKSTEDKHETNHINNKYIDVNYEHVMQVDRSQPDECNARCTTPEHALRARSLNPVMSKIPEFHPCTCASLLESLRSSPLSLYTTSICPSPSSPSLLPSHALRAAVWTVTELDNLTAP